MIWKKRFNPDRIIRFFFFSFFQTACFYEFGHPHSQKSIFFCLSIRNLSSAKGNVQNIQLHLTLSQFFFFSSPPRVCYYKMYNSIHVISGPHSRIVPSVVSCYVISSPSDCISLTVFAARLILPSLAWDIYRSNTTLSKARHSQKVREIGVISVCAFCLCVSTCVCSAGVRVGYLESR